MKKIITLILVLCLCFALIGCGGSGSSSSNYPDPSPYYEEEFGSAGARYDNGNLFVPLITYPKRRPRLQKSYVIQNDKCTWYVKTFTGVNTPVTSGKKKIVLPNKDGIVIVPEKYANDDYHIITWCSYKRGTRNVSYEYHILIRNR